MSPLLGALVPILGWIAAVLIMASRARRRRMEPSSLEADGPTVAGQLSGRRRSANEPHGESSQS